MQNPLSFDLSVLTPFPVLETERLRLRKLEQTDAPGIFVQRSDPRSIKYLDKEPLTELKEAEAFITKVLDDYNSHKAIAWAIELKATGRFIGDISLWRFFEKDHRAEIGYGHILIIGSVDT